MLNRTKSPVLALAVLVVVIGCALAWSSGVRPWANLWDFQWSVLRVGIHIHVSVAVVLLTGALCYAYTRSKRILLLTLVCTGLSLVVELLALHSPPPLSTSDWTFFDGLLQLGRNLARMSTVVPVLVLLSVRFPGRLAWLRLGCLLGIGGLVASDGIVAFGWTTPWLYRTATVAETVLLTAVILALAAAAWAVAFRQMPINRPPANAPKNMGITCPRCGLTQELSLPAGECTACRLRIFVALQEGSPPHNVSMIQ